jgi:hypothetical protein
MKQLRCSKIEEPTLAAEIMFATVKRTSLVTSKSFAQRQRKKLERTWLGLRTIKRVHYETDHL